ncbi:MAG: hypothetical protein AB1814_05490 [Thermodesulfobacteriota bacterium]
MRGWLYGKGLLCKRAHTQALDIREPAGLAERLGQPAKTMSGGQRQMLAGAGP